MAYWLRGDASWEDPSCICDGSSERWLHFNRKLTRDAKSLLNEAAIAYLLATLQRMNIEDSCIYWLSLTRLAELALLQAGVYADSCEFQAAGDLLVNPRRIDIRIRGRSEKVVKDRHRCLSDQLAVMMGDDVPVNWLRRNVRPQIRQEALLPLLKRMMASSGRIHEDYLVDFTRRMGKVAQTIAFLSAWQINDCADLYRRIRAASAQEEAFILSHLCRFDNERFMDMGRAVERIIFSADGITISSAWCGPPPRSFPV